MTRAPRSRARAVAAAAALAALAGCSHGGSGHAPAAIETPLRAAWRWVAPPPSYVGIPGADADGVAVTFGHSHVALLDGGGRVRWTFDRAGLRDVAPRLTAAAVLVPTEDGVVALDRSSGVPRWEARVGERCNTPVLAAGTAVVSTWEGSLVGLDPASGKVAWRSALPGPALAPAAADDATVVATWEAEHGAGAGAVGLDPASGRQRWAVALPEGGVSGPTLLSAPKGDQRLVVVVAGDIAAHALSAESGVERWRSPLEGAGSPEVVPLDAGDGAVLVGHRLGGLALLEAGDGRTRWTASSDGAAVRGGPAGPGPGGRFALPLDDGRVLLAGPGRPTDIVDPPGRVSGVAAGPGGLLLVATREATDNELTGSSGW